MANDDSAVGAKVYAELYPLKREPQHAMCGLNPLRCVALGYRALVVYQSRGIIMRPATATSMPHATASTVRRTAETAPRVAFSDKEEQLLNLNLSDLSIPKMNDLRVEGFKRTWFSRLFGG